jgi:hypothetical protein
LLSLADVSAATVGRMTDNCEAFLDAEGGPTNSVGAGGRLDLLPVFVVVLGDTTLTTGDEDAIFAASTLLSSYRTLLLSVGEQVRIISLHIAS